jgi:pimeloyl-ACP methyl ester carboxylesterase
MRRIGNDGFVLESFVQFQNRRIAFAEYGDPLGKPVFLCHGTPSSRLNRPDDRTTRALGVRLIVPNCRTTFLSGAGHMFFYDRWPDILTQLLAAAATFS